MVIPLDKQAHFLVGYALGVSLGLVAPALGLVVAFAFGLGKEAYDARHPDKHTADRYDFLATLLGGIAGSTLMLIAHYV